MKRSETKFYRGICTKDELIKFFLQVVGNFLAVKIPRDSVIIPVSKKRPNSHQVFGHDENGKLIPLEPKETITVGSMDCNVHLIDQVILVEYISRNGNEIIFACDDIGDKFFVDLRQKKYGSFFPDAFRRAGIKITSPAARK